MMWLSLNPRKIEYHTLIVGKCCQKHRNTTRRNPKQFVEEDLLWKMFINMKGYKNRMVSQGRLPEWNGME
jgi:hypothetical protein